MWSGQAYNNIYTMKQVEGSMLKDLNLFFVKDSIQNPPLRRWRGGEEERVFAVN